MPESGLSGWLLDYIEHLRVERGLSRRTVRAYRAVIRVFLRRAGV